MSSKVIKEREYIPLKDLPDRLQNEQNYKVLSMKFYEQSTFSSVIATTDGKTEYCLKIINMFNGVNEIDEDIYKSAKQEVQQMKKFDHKNVLKLIDSFEMGFYYIIVMEKYESTLEQWLQKKKSESLFLPQIISFSNQLFSAIKCIHSKGEIIRDIDLSTILIDKDNQIKIVMNGYSNISIHKRNQCVQINYIGSKVSLNYDQKQECNQTQVLSFQSLIKQSYISQLKEKDILAAIQIIYQLCGAKTVDKFNQNLVLTNLEDELINTLQEVFENKSKNVPKIEDILTNLEKVRKNIWESGIFSQNLYQTAIKLQLQPQEAINLLLLCIEQYPNNSQYNQSVGDLYKSVERYEDSAKAYNKCLEQDPENKVCKEKLADVYRLKSQSWQIQKDQIIQVFIQKGNPMEGMKPQYQFIFEQLKPKPPLSRVQGIFLSVFFSLFLTDILRILINIVMYFYVYAQLIICQENKEVCYSYSLESLKEYSMAEYHFFEPCVNDDTVGYLCNIGVGESLFMMKLNEDYISIFYSENPLEDSYKHFSQCLLQNQKIGLCYVFLADFYLMQEKYKESESIITNCLNVLPQDFLCINYFGNFYSLETNFKDYSKSIEYFEMCYKLYEAQHCKTQANDLKRKINFL